MSILALKKKVSKPIKTKESSKEVDTTFVLQNINTAALDKHYALSEITKKYTKKTKDEDMKSITTSLEKLGISNHKKEPTETIYYGDHYEINMFYNNGKTNTKLSDFQNNVKCSNCHQLPPKGALLMIVPYKYNSSFIHEHVYAPECINIVKDVRVHNKKEKDQGLKKAKKSVKTEPKVNYFVRDIPSSLLEDYKDNPDVVKNDYFEGSELVCSFSCMLKRALELVVLDPRYRNVKMYINWMYKKIFGHLPENIIPAPSFTMLKEYGGEMTLEEYRKDFTFIFMQDTNQYYSTALNIMNKGSKIYVTTKKSETSD